MESRPNKSREEAGVLLCYDGSGEADFAIRRAAELLRPRAAVVVHVRGRDSGESVARSGGAVALECGFAPVSTVEVAGRRVAEAVLEEAHRRAVAVIVAGSAGLSAADSSLLGSVSSTLVHHADLPVLVVRPPERLGDRDGSGPAFMCYDGSDEAHEAMFAAADLLAGRQAVVASFLEPIDDVVVLRTTLPWSAAAELQQRLARLARGEAERAAVTAGEGAVSAAMAGFATRQVPITGPGPAWARLLTAAVGEAASCVVVGHRWASMHLGSTAYGLVHHADRPVLVIPSGDRDVAPAVAPRERADA